MNKTELVDNIARKARLSNAEAARALNAMIDTVEVSLKNEDTVAIAGFGSFGVKNRNARNGVNPATGEKMLIGAKKSPCFKPGANLKKAILY
jgi:DNA-binding protein HU-beta